MTDLTGKVAVITGAGGNLGGCIAALLSRRGAKLVLSDINEAGLERCCAAVSSEGGDAVANIADVTNEIALAGLMDAAVTTFGGIDILVNNAGLIGQEHKLQLMDLDADLWDRTMAVNLKSVFLASKAALPHLIGRGGGSIINISSVASLSGNLMVNAYAASKGGVNTLTKYIATQYGKDMCAVTRSYRASTSARKRSPEPRWNRSINWRSIACCRALVFPKISRRRWHS